jgi:hypothetical protein
MRILALVILMLDVLRHLCSISPSLFSISRHSPLCVAFSRPAFLPPFTLSLSKSCKWMANKQALIPHQNKIKMAATTKEFRRYKININAHPTPPYSQYLRQRHIVIMAPFFLHVSKSALNVFIAHAEIRYGALPVSTFFCLR